MKDAKFGMAYSEARWMGGLPVEVSVLFVKFFELGCCRAMIVAPPGSPITNIAKLRDHTAGVVDGEINHGVVEVSTISAMPTSRSRISRRWIRAGHFSARK